MTSSNTVFTKGYVQRVYKIRSELEEKCSGSRCAAEIRSILNLSPSTTSKIKAEKKVTCF